MPFLLDYTPPIPPFVADWSGLAGMTWTGWDGSVWDLLDPSGGVFLAPTVRGLSTPSHDRFTSSSPAIAGSRHRGHRVIEREITWNVWVVSDLGSDDWQAKDAAFHATMRPDRTGVWEITRHDGTRRRLTCRFVEDATQTFDMDPTAHGWQLYQLILVAEQPFWLGDSVTQTFKNSDPVNFFGGVPGGFAAPFVIGAGSTIASATLTNPGEESASPVWTVTGPCTTVTLGVGPASVTLTAPLAAGAVRVVDTRPNRLTVMDADGADKFSELSTTSQMLQVVPPGKSVPLSLSMSGTGTVRVDLSPLFRRAW